MKLKKQIELGLAKPCGAMTVRGTPCKCRMVFDNGRCRLHGGIGTMTAEAAWFQWRKKRLLKEVEDFRQSLDPRFRELLEKLRERKRG